MSTPVGIMNGNFRAGDHYRYRLEVEAGERREAEKRAEKKMRGMTLDVCQEIRDMMTQGEYDAWWKESPDEGFFNYACDTLLKMKGY